MSSDTRRERANNFTENEKDLLLKIVIENFFPIIESKKTDAGSIKEKNDAWFSVSEIFNESSYCNIPRNVIQLRNAYHNMKKRLRKEFSSEEDKTQYITTLSKVNSIKGKYMQMLNLLAESHSTITFVKDPAHTFDDFVAESDTKELHEESDSHPANDSAFDIEQPETCTTTERNRATNNFTFKNNLRKRKLFEVYKNIDSNNFNKKLQIECEILQIKKRREEEGLQIDKVKRLQEEEKLKQQKIQTELLKMQLRRSQSEEIIIGD